MKCPRCGSRDTAKILYGLPAYDEDLQEKLHNGKVVLGGCCISPYDPKYHCNTDTINYGQKFKRNIVRTKGEFYATINYKMSIMEVETFI